MTKELAHELRLKLDDFSIFTKIAGIAQPVTVFKPTEDGKNTDKVIPVTYDHNQKECEGKEIDLVPDSTMRGILYFEDLGSTVTAGRHGFHDFNSRLLLVGWLNRELISQRYTEITGKVIAMILGRLVNTNPVNVGIFSKLKVKAEKISEQSNDIFKKYSYNEKETQYLRPPFEYFAITLLCSYSVNPACVEQDFNFSDWACYNDKDAIITEKTEIPIITEKQGDQILKEK